MVPKRLNIVFQRLLLSVLFIIIISIIIIILFV